MSCLCYKLVLPAGKVEGGCHFCAAPNCHRKSTQTRGNRFAKPSQAQLPTLCRLDTTNRGYIELYEWGTRDPMVSRAVKQLTTAYMRRKLGFPSQVDSPEKVETFSRTFRAKEVTSLSQAVALASEYCFRKGLGLSSDGSSPMLSAFKFLDTNNSGKLDRCGFLCHCTHVGNVLNAEYSRPSRAWRGVETTCV